MTPDNRSETPLTLAQVFDGWSGYQTSLVRALAPLTAAQLAWRPVPHVRPIGELARHISLGRLGWFRRMDAPESAALSELIPAWTEDGDGNRYIVESALDIAEDAAQLVAWLERTWRMIDATLHAWNVSDLFKRYRHTWNGEIYAIPRQWTLWRILTHDVHHGGELSLLLDMQGIPAFELRDLGGHITLPQLAPDTEGAT